MKKISILLTALLSMLPASLVFADSAVIFNELANPVNVITGSSNAPLKSTGVQLVSDGQAYTIKDSNSNTICQFNTDSNGKVSNVTNTATNKSTVGQCDLVGNYLEITPAETCYPAQLTLKSGHELLSSNGQFSLRLQSSDSNLVLYENYDAATQGSKAVFALNLKDPPPPGHANLVFQYDANLVLYNTYDNSPAWSTNTEGHQSSSPKLCLQNDGNLVIYSTIPSQKVLWASNSVQPKKPENIINNTKAVMSIQNGPMLDSMPAGNAEPVIPGRQYAIYSNYELVSTLVCTFNTDSTGQIYGVQNKESNYSCYQTLDGSSVSIVPTSVFKYAACAAGYYINNKSHKYKSLGTHVDFGATCAYGYDTAEQAESEAETYCNDLNGAHDLQCGNIKISSSVAEDEGVNGSSLDYAEYDSDDTGSDKQIVAVAVGAFGKKSDYNNMGVNTNGTKKSDNKGDFCTFQDETDSPNSIVEYGSKYICMSIDNQNKRPENVFYSAGNKNHNKYGMKNVDGGFVYYAYSYIS
ncbi:MAG: hypothetical protein AAGA27_06650 [Pseudomonadota bacterium]